MQPYDEREARRHYIRTRQRRVLTITAAVLAAILVVALLFFFHVFGLGRVETPTAKPNYGVTVPCASANSDGTPGTILNAHDVKVRVLNGTSFPGFAQAVSAGLENRGFQTQNADNYSSHDVERTTIYFGVNAVNAAYTVNAHFTDAVMVMDDRTDDLVDIVLGATFDDLKTSDQVLAAGSPIESFDGCVPADQMSDLPQAIAH